MSVGPNYAPAGQSTQATPLLQQNAMNHGDGRNSQMATTGLQNGPRAGLYGSIFTDPPGPTQYGFPGPAYHTPPIGARNPNAGRRQAGDVMQSANPRGGYQLQGAASLGRNVNQTMGSSFGSTSTNYQGESSVGPYRNTIIRSPTVEQYATNLASYGRPVGMGNADGNRAFAGEAPRSTQQQADAGFAAPALLPHPRFLPPSAPQHPNNAGRSGSGDETLRPADVTRGSRGQPRGIINPPRSNARGGITKTRGCDSGRARGPKRISYADFKKERRQALADGTALQTSEPVQAVLDRAAPIRPNAPIPDWRQIGGTLRNNFGGSDLRGPPNLGNAGGAAGGNVGGDSVGGNATRGDTAVDGGNELEAGQEDGVPGLKKEDAEDDEEDVPGEEVADDE